MDYAVTGGSATGGGIDYTLASGTLTFTAGDTSEDIVISVVDDALDEGDETIEVTLSNPVNATLGSKTEHTYTIKDNDDSLTVQFDKASSNDDESDTPANLEVVLTTDPTEQVTVDYAVTGGSATGGGIDYTLASGTLTFTAGDTSENIAIGVVDDALDEGDETIEVTLANPVNATLGSKTEHTYTIKDNDDGLTVQFDKVNSHDDEDVTPANLEVELSGVSGQQVTVDYLVSGGSATGGGIDYTLASGTLTFAPGDTSKFIVISVVDDALDEAQETVVLTIYNPSNADLGNHTEHTFQIKDNDNDDPPPVVAPDTR